MISMKEKGILCFSLTSFTIGWFFAGLGDNCGAAIIYPKAPKGGQEIAHEYVAWTLQATPNFFRGVRIDKVAVVNPHQNYTVDPQDVTSGNLLSAAKATAWRYLVMDGANAIGVAELKADKKADKGLKVVAVYQGVGPKILVALQEADKLSQVKKEDYEFRFLNLAPISFFAVWLHGKTDDIIIPLPPTWDKWKAYWPYSEGEMIKLLKPVCDGKMEAQLEE